MATACSARPSVSPPKARLQFDSRDTSLFVPFTLLLITEHLFHFVRGLIYEAAVVS
jgi:hypothetical protein